MFRFLKIAINITAVLAMSVSTYSVISGQINKPRLNSSTVRPDQSQLTDEEKNKLATRDKYLNYEYLTADQVWWFKEKRYRVEFFLAKAFPSIDPKILADQLYNDCELSLPETAAWWLRGKNIKWPKDQKMLAYANNLVDFLNHKPKYLEDSPWLRSWAMIIYYSTNRLSDFNLNESKQIINLVTCGYQARYCPRQAH